MTVDPAIYGFISQPYRYAQAVDSTVQTTFEQARLVEVPGLFSQLADAETLNQTLFDLIKVPRRRFRAEVHGLDFVRLDDYDGQVPCATLKSERYGLQTGLLVALVGLELNASKNITLLDCWG